MKKYATILIIALFTVGFAFSANLIDSSSSKSDLFEGSTGDIETPLTTIWSDDFSSGGGDWTTNTVQDFKMADSPGVYYETYTYVTTYTTDPLDFSGADITSPGWTYYADGYFESGWDYLCVGYYVSASPPTSMWDFTLSWYSGSFSGSYTEDLSSLASESSVYLGFVAYSDSIFTYDGVSIDTTYVRDSDLDPLIWGDEFNSGRTYESYGKWSRLSEGITPSYDYWDAYWDGTTYDTAWEISYWETPDDDGGYNHYYTAEPGFNDSRFCNYPYNEATCDNADYTYFELTAPIDLTGYADCSFSWWERGALETGVDENLVMISTDGGSSWDMIDDGEDALTDAWAQKVIDISSWADGESDVRFQFRMDMDSSWCYDGWYIDDLMVEGEYVALQSTSLGSIKTMFE